MGFRICAGRRYANGRNTDHGPGAHKAVSVLSPYIRRRLVLEQDAVAMAVACHGPEDAEKFIQEVIWRGYFKGWLERRPQVWDSYRAGLEGDLSALDRDRRLRRDLDRAMDGQTGLECFDAWATELVDTGYLHNHARMWFASIWIFTLGLPWRLGADFFYRHLLDGDAASNTLGWRWVAGLHTRGKPYPADAQNIATFTAGRFAPRQSDLAEVTQGLEATEPDGLPTVLPLRSILPPQPGRATALLITDEDCRVEDFDLAALDIRTTATLAASSLRSPLAVSDLVTRFEADALADAAMRVGASPVVLQAADPADLAKWAARAGATQIATPYITRGPLRDWLDQAPPSLAKHGITLCEWRRDWDSAIWPHATAGFFKVKQNIPRILEQVLPA
jgi:deoxyribodipyrimidine photo-lyase